MQLRRMGQGAFILQNSSPPTPMGLWKVIASSIVVCKQAGIARVASQLVLRLLRSSRLTVAKLGSLAALIPLLYGLIGVTDLSGKPLIESCSWAVCMALNDPSGGCYGCSDCLLVRTKNLHRVCLVLTDAGGVGLSGLALLIDRLVNSEATEGYYLLPLLSLPWGVLACIGTLCSFYIIKLSDKAIIISLQPAHSMFKVAIQALRLHLKQLSRSENMSFF